VLVARDNSLMLVAAGQARAGTIKRAISSRRHSSNVGIDFVVWYVHMARIFATDSEHPSRPGT
jgi:hypothetical protein